MTDVRWIGRQGEKLFSLLCSRKMVTCNKAEEDDRGWDFLLQFPPPSVLHVPIDRRSDGPTALVQIKATRVGAERWSISLKNALSLARSPLPAFIVCVGINEAGRETFRAVHVWRDHIGRILKAARQAHVEGDEATNRRSVSFELGPEAARADILGWIIGEIETVGEHAYAAAKQLLVDTLGFESGNGVAHLTLGTQWSEAFLDLQLGMLPSIPVERFRFTPSRFGIEASAPEVDIVGGRLEMIPKGRHGVLRLRSPDGRQEHLPAELFSAALPERRRTKTRIRAEPLDVVVSSKGRFAVSCADAWHERMTLDRIAAYALVRESSRAARLAIGLKTEGAIVDLGQINMKGPHDAEWQKLYVITEGLRRVIAFENAEPIVTSIDAMDKEFVALSAFDALVSIRSLRIEFVPEGGVEGEFGTFLAHAAVRFDGIEMGAVASRPVVRDVMVGTRRRLDLGPATILHASICDASVSMHDRYLDELDRLSEAADVLAIGDLQCFASPEHRDLLVDIPRLTPQRLRRASSD